MESSDLIGCSLVLWSQQQPQQHNSQHYIPTNAASLNNSDHNHLHRVSGIITKLLENYDSRLRPKFGSGAMDIYMELIVASIDSISEVNMDYTITVYLNQHWQDERLAFNPDVPNLMMTLPGDFSNNIWVPDTFLANDKYSFLHDVTEKNKMLRIYGDGRLFFGMRFTTTLACMMDLHYYPLDKQNCTVEIESYGYPIDDVKMHWKGGRSAVKNIENLHMIQFVIKNYEVSSWMANLSTGLYQRLSLSFQLQRNVGFFVFQTYLPSILIVLLSWVSFWISHEATSARVALGITTVLTMTTISTGVRSSLPRISYVKAIDVYLVVCFAFVFSALLEYAAVNYTFWGKRARRQKANLAAAAAASSVDTYFNVNATPNVGRSTTSSNIIHQQIQTEEKEEEEEEEEDDDEEDEVREGDDRMCSELWDIRQRQYARQHYNRLDLLFDSASPTVPQRYHLPISNTTATAQQAQLLSQNEMYAQAQTTLPSPVSFFNSRQNISKDICYCFPEENYSDIRLQSLKVGSSNTKLRHRNSLRFMPSLNRLRQRRRRRQHKNHTDHDSIPMSTASSTAHYSVPFQHHHHHHHHHNQLPDYYSSPPPPSPFSVSYFSSHMSSCNQKKCRSSVPTITKSSAMPTTPTTPTTTAKNLKDFVKASKSILGSSKNVAMRIRLPKIRDINIIDKYSRVVFPVFFILFNILYFCIYSFL